MEKKHRSSSPKPGLRKGWCIQFSRVTTRPSPCSSSSVSTSGNPSDSIFRSTRSRCPTQAGADNLSWIVFTLKTNSLYWGTCHYGEKGGRQSLGTGCHHELDTCHVHNNKSSQGEDGPGASTDQQNCKPTNMQQCKLYGCILPPDMPSLLHHVNMTYEARNWAQLFQCSTQQKTHNPLLQHLW